MPGLPVYELPSDHQLDGPAMAESMARSGGDILPPSADADTRNVHVPGPADGIGYDAVAVCVEPVTPVDDHAAELARQHFLQAGHTRLLDVDIQRI
jgi:hypothetical protein